MSLLLVLHGAAPSHPQAEAPSSPGLESFDAAWKIIDEQHFDPNHNGVDWRALRDRLRPRARAARNLAETREVIEEMLQALGQSHFALLPSNPSTKGARPRTAQSPGTAGIDLRIRRGQAWVVRVEPDSPAYRAGVRPGWLLRSIEGSQVRALLAELPKPSLLPASSVARKALLGRLDGAPNTQLRLRFQPSSIPELRELSITRIRREAFPYKVPGLGTLQLVLRKKRIEAAAGAVGVLHFSNWFAGIEEQLDQALFGMRDCVGIVLDLRGNSGGEGRIARKVAGHFFSSACSLGSQVRRYGIRPYGVEPRKRHRGQSYGTFGGPLVILIDETTGSCSEVFAGGMQALGRARIIGERSAGAALPAIMSKLPNGDHLLHAIANFLTPDGKSLEGAGVLPEERIGLDRGTLLAGRDGPLEAALAWIAEQ